MQLCCLLLLLQYRAPELVIGCFFKAESSRVTRFGKTRDSKIRLYWSAFTTWNIWTPFTSARAHYKVTMWLL